MRREDFRGGETQGGGVIGPNWEFNSKTRMNQCWIQVRIHIGVEDCIDSRGTSPSQK